ncbi:MAG: hypothetical protein DCF19_02875 [Pseudanabaena frigida]|uniref:Serine protease n=1 Tax=Pseudanabaena frigida TaxID=945775 RepID=A0A2W4WI67_9CYAN|nr:MAG: hypothetical protein DCF19_02875 [Pseudanabaena frigida]
MYHQLPPDFLYSAHLLKVIFNDSSGSTKEILGTGFVLAIKDDVPMIITNRHVVELDYKQPTAKYKDYSLSELYITGRRADNTTYSFRIAPSAKVFYSDIIENDIALIESKVYADSYNQDGWHFYFNLEHLATKEVFDNQLEPYDDVAFAGFPDSYDKVANRPILRSGKIASDPKYDYSWSRSFEGSCVAYEAFSSGGASGSPVFAPPKGVLEMPRSRDGYLVGINAGHVKDPDFYSGHSGISYFYKSTVIWDILHKEGLI